MHVICNPTCDRFDRRYMNSLKGRQRNSEGGLSVLCQKSVPSITGIECNVRQQYRFI